MHVSVRIPGRINLIGDHTDYTGGLVMPTVVDMHTEISGSYNSDDRWILVSDSHGEASIPLDIDDARLIVPEWARYPAGVLVELRRHGFRMSGFTGSVTTTIPIGGGLSSSAALEIAAARIALGHPLAVASNGGLPDDVELAQICRRAEISATGVPCGIMDQLSIVTGRQGQATMIDCSTLEVAYVPLPDRLRVEHRFVSPRTLSGSEYAERVAQCAEIESIIGPLRFATLDDVNRIDSVLLRRRARHVISENARVIEFARALTDGRFEDAGRLMVQSHRSLADDFDTSTPSMDAAVESAIRETGVLGARMTGGGFGGCIVVLREITSDD